MSCLVGVDDGLVLFALLALAYMLVGRQRARSSACCAAGWGLGRNVVVGVGGGLLVWPWRKWWANVPILPRNGSTLNGNLAMCWSRNHWTVLAAGLSGVEY